MFPCLGIPPTPEKYPHLSPIERARRKLWDEQDENTKLRADLYEAKQEIERLRRELRSANMNR